MWSVAMDGLHCSKVFVTHVKHLCTFPLSQVCWTVLQGGRLLILVPVLLQSHKHIKELLLVVHSKASQDGL